MLLSRVSAVLSRENFARRVGLAAVSICLAVLAGLSVVAPAMAQSVFGSAAIQAGGPLSLPAQYVAKYEALTVDVLLLTDGTVTLKLEGGGAPCPSRSRFWQANCERASKGGPQQFSGAVAWDAVAGGYRGIIDDSAGQAKFETLLTPVVSGKRLLVSFPTFEAQRQDGFTFAFTGTAVAQRDSVLTIRQDTSEGFDALSIADWAGSYTRKRKDTFIGLRLSGGDISSLSGSLFLVPLKDNIPESNDVAANGVWLHVLESAVKGGTRWHYDLSRARQVTGEPGTLEIEAAPQVGDNITELRPGVRLSRMGQGRLRLSLIEPGGLSNNKVPTGSVVLSVEMRKGEPFDLPAQVAFDDDTTAPAPPNDPQAENTSGNDDNGSGLTALDGPSFADPDKGVFDMLAFPSGSVFDRPNGRMTFQVPQGACPAAMAASFCQTVQSSPEGVLEVTVTDTASAGPVSYGRFDAYGKIHTFVATAGKPDIVLDVFDADGTRSRTVLGVRRENEKLKPDDSTCREPDARSCTGAAYAAAPRHSQYTRHVGSHHNGIRKRSRRSGSAVWQQSKPSSARLEVTGDTARLDLQSNTAYSLNPENAPFFCPEIQPIASPRRSNGTGQPLPVRWILGLSENSMSRCCPDHSLAEPQSFGVMLQAPSLSGAKPSRPSKMATASI